jgi:hypothetical protein
MVTFAQASMPTRIKASVLKNLFRSTQQARDTKGKTEVAGRKQY